MSDESLAERMKAEYQQERKTELQKSQERKAEARAQAAAIQWNDLWGKIKDLREVAEGGTQSVDHDRARAFDALRATLEVAEGLALRQMAAQRPPAPAPARYCEMAWTDPVTGYAQLCFYPQGHGGDHSYEWVAEVLGNLRQGAESYQRDIRELEQELARVRHERESYHQALAQARRFFDDFTAARQDYELLITEMKKELRAQRNLISAQQLRISELNGARRALGPDAVSAVSTRGRVLKVC